MQITGWQIYLIWLAMASTVTFILYGYDKRQARKKGWRVAENTLHLMAFLGGFPGGWVGRSVFRHKTKKTNFFIILLASTVIHIGMAYWVFFN